MSRRQARSGGAAGATAEMREAVRVVGATGFDASNYYATPSPGGEAGVDTGFGVFVMFRVTTQAVSSANRVLAERYGGVSGWRILTAGSNGTVRFWSANDVGGIILSPAYTITAGDVGKVMMAEGYHSGSTVGLRVNRVEIGTPTAITGYTAASDLMSVGRGASDGITVYGVATHRRVLTLAQSQAVFDDVKLARDILGSGAQPTNAWSFKRAGGAVPPASVSNLAGADALSRQGSATTYDTTLSPVWGW